MIGRPPALGEERGREAPGPVVDEVRGDEEEPERSEHGVARAVETGREEEEEERDDRDQHPFPPGRVPQVEERTAHCEPGSDVHPEAIGPVDARADEHQEEADEDRDDSAPCAAVRDQIDDEQPHGRRDGDDQQRELVARDQRERGDEGDEIEQQQADVEAADRRVIGAEQVDPDEDRRDEDDKGDERDDREEPCDDPHAGRLVAAGQRRDDEQDERRPGDEREVTVLVGEVAQQADGRAEKDEHARVVKERGARPRSPDCTHGRRSSISRRTTRAGRISGRRIVAPARHARAMRTRRRSRRRPPLPPRPRR